MDRRDFLRFTGLASASIMYPTLAPPAFAQGASADKWRIFEVSTRVEILKPAGVTRVWLPTPLTQDTPYHKTLGNAFQVRPVLERDAGKAQRDRPARAEQRFQLTRLLGGAGDHVDGIDVGSTASRRGRSCRAHRTVWIVRQRRQERRNRRSVEVLQRSKRGQSHRFRPAAVERA